MTVTDMTDVADVEDPWATVPVIGAGGAHAVHEDRRTPEGEPGAGWFRVRCDPAGDPCELVYRGREQRILQPVIHWYERRNWWDVEARVPRESTTSAVDRERLRVQAVQPGSVVARTFDLARDRVTEQWRLVRVSC